jgi:hypothetical protein
LRTLIFWVALGFCSLSVAAETKSCPASILSQLWPHAVALEESSYREKVLRWRAVLSTKPLLPAVLQPALAADNSLLNWVALHDAFLSEAASASLFEVAKSLADRGVRITERSSVFDSDLSGISKLRWLPMWGTKRVALCLPRKIPDASGEWIAWLFHQLQSLGNAFSEPLLLHAPSAINAIAHAEFRIYEIGYQLQTHSGVSLALPVGTLPAYSPLREGLTYSWKWVFPSRSQLRWHPQNQLFQKYVSLRQQSESPEGSFDQVETEVRRSYPARLRVYRFCQYYRSLLLLGAAGTITVGSVELVDALRSESWRAQVQAVQTLGSVAADASAREQAIRDYADSETGYDPVIEYYTEAIETLRTRQATEGDPDGALEREIQFKFQQMQELQR